jgi:O-antigen/teichoic acid export membrane protein
MAVSAVGESAAPRLARYYAQHQRAAFGGVLLRLVGVAGVLGGGGIAIALLAGPQVLALLYGRQYAAYNDLLVWVMVAAAIGFVGSFLGYAVTAARYFLVQIPLFALVVAAGVAACWWLVPRMGLQGAALALCVSAVAQVVGMGLVLGHAITVRRGNC